MAKLSQLPAVFRSVGPWTLFKRVWQQLGEDDVFTLGAAMAYSWLFAVFPFVVFLISLVPLMPEQYKAQVHDDIRETLKEAKVPDDVSDILMRPVNDLRNKPSAGGFLSFGLILAMWAASGGMNMTMFAMDKAYDVEKRRPFYIQRPLAILLTIVVAIMIILVMILMPVGTGVVEWLIRHSILPPGWAFLVNIARYAIALVLLFGVLALIYHFGPSFKRKFNPISVGAVFSIGVWLLLGQLFKLYLTSWGGAANYNKTYGAVAGAAILLLFFYIDSLVLLVGAEINSEMDRALGVEPPK